MVNAAAAAVEGVAEASAAVPVDQVATGGVLVPAVAKVGKAVTGEQEADCESENSRREGGQ